MPGQMPGGALLRDLRDPDGSAISPSVRHYHTPTNGAHGSAILRDLRQPDGGAAAGSESACRLTKGGGEKGAWPSSAASEGSEVSGVAVRVRNMVRVRIRVSNLNPNPNPNLNPSPNPNPELGLGLG